MDYIKIFYNNGGVGEFFVNSITIKNNFLNLTTYNKQIGLDLNTIKRYEIYPYLSIMNTNLIEDFKNGDLSIICRTEKEYNEFFNFLKDKEIQYRTIKKKPFNDNYCFFFEENDIGYAPIERIIVNDSIMTFAEFIKEIGYEIKDSCLFY